MLFLAKQLHLECLCVILSQTALWFVQIKGEFESTTSVSDDRGHIVTPGQKYMLEHFLEQVSDQITRKTYKLIDKEMIFYRQSLPLC